MAQRRKSGTPRKITKYQLRYKDGNDKGVFYVSYSKKVQAVKQRKKLKKSFGNKVSWTVHKIKRNVWVPRGMK